QWNRNAISGTRCRSRSRIFNALFRCIRDAISKTKTPPFAAGSSWGDQAKSRSGGDALFHLVRLAQHIAAAPHCFDEIASFRGVGELLAQLADEDVDDLQFRLVHSATEVI